MRQSGSAQTPQNEPVSILFLDFLRKYLPHRQPIYLGFGTGVFEPRVYGGVARALCGQHFDFNLPLPAQMDLIFGDFSSDPVLVMTDLCPDEGPYAFLQEFGKGL